MTALNVLIYQSPDGGWVVATDERSIPIRYATRDEAERMARMLTTKYGSHDKAAEASIQRVAELGEHVEGRGTALPT